MNKILRSILPKSNSPTFQVVSDLHLEVGQQYHSYNIPPSASFLILGGDIGRLIDYNLYLQFLERHTSAFEKIFLVLGNHEFYGLSYAAGIEQAGKLQEEPTLESKVVLLNQTRFDIPDSPITILGCTLWSKIPEQAVQAVRARVKDFQRINGWTIDDHNTAFESDCTWLKKAVVSITDTRPRLNQKHRKRTVLVVTHHAPSICGTSHPNHEKNPWSSAFATDLLTDRVSWSNVSVWIFGHTHFTTDFVYSGVRLLSNQRGYVLPGSVEMAKSSRRSGKDLHAFNVRRVLHV